MKASKLVLGATLVLAHACTADLQDSTSMSGSGSGQGPGSGGQIPRPGGGSGGSGTGGGSGGGTGVVDTRFNFRCQDETAEPASDLRRLTSEQIRNVYGDLLTDTVGNVNDQRGADERLELLPEDLASATIDYARMSQSVGQAHVDAYHGSAAAFASITTETNARLSSLMGSCATNGNGGDDAACVRNFAESFARKAWSKKPSTVEVDFLVNDVYAANGIDNDAVRDLVTAILMAPDFVYVVERGGQEVPGHPGAYQLTGYELAKRLALHFWKSIPDEELLDAAEDGSLLTESGYAAQVERLVQDPRTIRAIDDFFEQWLHLDRIPRLDANIGRADFRAYAGEDLPGPELSDRLREDALDLVRHVVWADAAGTLADLFTLRASFARTEDLARIYGGVDLYQDGAAPPELPAGERAGILTRPAMLVNDQATTRPSCGS
ncbi:MAG: DUF1592 domain-containing protein, partial [Myxococcales bacterium]|nr:DUF1592 domain-containing protein [Myxococcales bacterium]